MSTQLGAKKAHPVAALLVYIIFVGLALLPVLAKLFM